MEVSTHTSVRAICLIDGVIGMGDDRDDVPVSKALAKVIAVPY